MDQNCAYCMEGELVAQFGIKICELPSSKVYLFMGASSFARRLFASRVIPVADAYCSKQPLFLQPQTSVSLSSICQARL